MFMQSVKTILTTGGIALGVGIAATFAVAVSQDVPNISNAIFWGFFGGGVVILACFREIFGKDFWPLTGVAGGLALTGHKITANLIEAGVIQPNFLFN